MEYSEYIEKVQKQRTRKKSMIRNSYGVRDAFNHYRKTKPSGSQYVLTDVQYYSIIRNVNNILCDLMCSGEEISLPHGMGILTTRRLEPVVEFVGDRIRNDHPVSWQKTLRLWYEDKEAERNKTLVREIVDYWIIPVYNTATSRFRNRKMFSMKFNRNLRKRIYELGKQGKLDSYLKY